MLFSLLLSLHQNGITTLDCVYSHSMALIMISFTFLLVGFVILLDFFLCNMNFGWKMLKSCSNLTMRQTSYGVEFVAGWGVCRYACNISYIALSISIPSSQAIFVVLLINLLKFSLRLWMYWCHSLLFKSHFLGKCLKLFTIDWRTLSVCSTRSTPWLEKIFFNFCVTGIMNVDITISTSGYREYW